MASSLTEAPPVEFKTILAAHRARVLLRCFRSFNGDALISYGTLICATNEWAYALVVSTYQFHGLGGRRRSIYLDRCSLSEGTQSVAGLVVVPAINGSLKATDPL